MLQTHQQSSQMDQIKKKTKKRKTKKGKNNASLKMRWALRGTTLNVFFRNFVTVFFKWVCLPGLF